MATFFFDFCQGNSVEQDDLGLSFDSVEEAYLEAYGTAAALWAELLQQRQDPRRCAFQVRDLAGTVLFSLPFVELLENCDDSVGYKPLSLLRQRIACSAQRARELRTDVERELNLTREAVREAVRLVGASTDIKQTPN
jgi:hypothetical protein